MRKSELGAASSADRETRILKLKAYLNMTDPENYRSDVALRISETRSWRTFLSYLTDIEKRTGVNDFGRENLKIACREATLLDKVKRARHDKIHRLRRY